MGAVTLSAVAGLGPLGRLAAQDRYDQEALLQFYPLGQITLMHLSDLHGHLLPLYHREPEVHLGPDGQQRAVPHLTGEALRVAYGIGGRGPMDYALTHEDFAALARAYGKMGGLARIATVVQAIRAARPGALLLSGGNMWSEEARETAQLLEALRVDAAACGNELDAAASAPNFPLLAQNATEDRDALTPDARFERGGTQIAVIGQAFARVPGWTKGVAAARLQERVDKARAEGAGVVVLLSQAGFGADMKLAQTISGLDIILSGHDQIALPEPLIVEGTHLVASGSHGKFLSRLDLEVTEGRLTGLRHRLIPIFAQIIGPDAQLARRIAAVRAPFAAELDAIVGRAEGLLFRRGTYAATWDTLIGTALARQMDAEIVLTPGTRWGRSVLPGDPITRADIRSVTGARSRGARKEMTGAALKDRLEQAADELFRPDPFERIPRDMVRAQGLRFRVDAAAPLGQRIKDLTLARTGVPLEPGKGYAVATQDSASADESGAPLTETVERHMTRFYPAR
ncbi:MAG: 5'-nucleotidase C-terminal domain-containing protein [Pseudomonadota bacterium]